MATTKRNMLTRPCYTNRCQDCGGHLETIRSRKTGIPFGGRHFGGADRKGSLAFRNVQS